MRRNCIILRTELRDIRMIVPNKIVPIEESAISKAAVILGSIKDEGSIIELYHSTARRIGSIDQFIYALDFLFLIGLLDVDLDQGAYRRAA